MGRGALVFKGDGDGGKKKKRSVPNSVDTKHKPLESTASQHHHQQQQRPVPPQMKRGRGKISTSGSVVTGHDTRFLSEIGVGDALLVDIPHSPFDTSTTAANDSTTSTTNSTHSTGTGTGTSQRKPPQQEMRIVTMRLSDISLNLSSAFSQNVSTPRAFSYIAKPRDVALEAAVLRERAAATALAEERHRGPTVADNGEMAVRERTEHGNYRMKRIKMDRGAPRNRSDLLDIRTKRTSDKYC